MVNAKHDISSYESVDYKREIYNSNALYDAYKRAKIGSDWKPQVQQFEMNYLAEISKIQKEIEDKTYKFSPSTEFVLNERGKTRVVRGEQIRDRVVKHSLCDEVLTPELKKYLIYDNGASTTGKGISFSRKRLLIHLRKYYMQHKTNDGYILLMDFSKYYDNINHDILMSIFKKYITDETALWLSQETINHSKVDVSYMNNDEYKNCLNELFNSLEHHKINKNLLKKEKFMSKHLNIGDQVAQTAGIAYPIKLDNYIKIVKGVKLYGRYMDDSYIIHDDKEYLKKILKDIVTITDELGITINTKKTKIYKLSDYWKFLQIQYSMTDTGRIIQKINPKRLIDMRRKMKKLCFIFTEKRFRDWFNAWFQNNYKIMSKLQRENINKLFEEIIFSQYTNK